MTGPTPHGVGGLKYKTVTKGGFTVSPTPHGVGGLKFWFVYLYYKDHQSHPSRGGWIEIFQCSHTNRLGTVPPLTGWVD